MADHEYSVIERQIAKAENKVKQAIQRFQPDNLNNNDLVDNLHNLKEITVLQEKLEDLIYDILNVSPEGLQDSEI